MKILILANYDLGLYKFRRELLEALVGAGHEVICCLPDGPLVPAIEALGCRFVPCPWLSRHGMNPAAAIQRKADPRSLSDEDIDEINRRVANGEAISF